MVRFASRSLYIQQKWEQPLMNTLKNRFWVDYFIVRKGFHPPFFKAPTPWPSLPHPFKNLCVSSTVLFHPLLRYFRQFPTLKQISPALIWPTNPFWFKQISKGPIYQFNCRFLSKSILIFQISLQIGYLNSWDILGFIFRQLKINFFYKIMVIEKNNFS